MKLRLGFELDVDVFPSKTQESSTEDFEGRAHFNLGVPIGFPGDDSGHFLFLLAAQGKTWRAYLTHLNTLFRELFKMVMQLFETRNCIAKGNICIIA